MNEKKSNTFPKAISQVYLKFSPDLVSICYLQQSYPVRIYGTETV